MIKFKKLKKRAIAFALAGVITLSSFITELTAPAVTVHADANDRVKSFINLAKGEAETDLDLDGLTTEDLRFLGIYLSNFYVPFGTELGTTQEDVIASTKEQMVKALQNNLNFSDETASVLVDNIIQMSRDTAVDMVVRIGTGAEAKDPKPDAILNVELSSSNDINIDGNTVKEVYGDNMCYAEFLIGMLGETRSSFSRTMGDLSCDTVYLGVEKDGKFFPMASYYDKSTYTINAKEGTAKVLSTNRTPFQGMFMKCLNSVSAKYGFGTSLFDFTSEEAGNSASAIGKLFESDDISGEDIYVNTIFNSMMCVDCFGNIIAKGPNHQYVVMPACMNPYVWQGVKDDGSDNTETGLPGSHYFFTNAMCMSMLDSGTMFTKDTFDDTSRMLDMSNAIHDLYDATDENSLTKTVLGEHKIKDTNYGNTNCMAYKIFRGATGKDLIDTTIIGKSETQSKIDKLNEWLLSKKHPALLWWMYNACRVIQKEDGSGSDNVIDALSISEKNNYLYGFYTRRYYIKKWDETNGTLEGLKSPSSATDVSSTAISQRVNVDKNRNCWAKIVMIDTLGAFEGDSSDSTINISSYMDKKGESPKKLMEEWGKSKDNGFTQTAWSKIQEGEILEDINIGAQAAACLYTTYVLAGLYKDDAESKKNTIGKLGYRIYSEGLPLINPSGLEFSEEQSENLMDKSIKEYQYYLLHPTEGAEYVQLLLRKWLNSFLVRLHHDILGTNAVGYTMGTTHYKSSSGFLSMPDLNDAELTAQLLGIYNSSIPFLTIVMMVIMIFTYLSGILPLQKSFFSWVLFSGALFLPIPLINNVVGLSNDVAQRIYSDRFIYWALVQSETYSDAIDEAGKADTYENYLAKLYAENEEVYTNQGSDSIIVKWQAPKKMASLMLTKEDQKTLDGLKDSKLVTAVLGRNRLSGETYVGTDKVYLYRSYIDLMNFSRYIYNGLVVAKNKPIKSELELKKYLPKGMNIFKTPSSKDNYFDDIKARGETDVEKGYTNESSRGYNRVTIPISSSIYADSIQFTFNQGHGDYKVDMNNLTTRDKLGINQEIFNFSIPMFNHSGSSNAVDSDSHTTKAETYSYKSVLEANSTPSNAVEINNYWSVLNYEDADFSGLAGYSLMSESPFYYFSWSLYDQGVGTSASDKNGYKNLLLAPDNGGYFYNMKGNGELKDFLDMRSLFTYIIPYCRLGNIIVKSWDEKYGLKIYDGIPTTEGHWEDAGIKDNPEMLEKYWHNVNVARLYEIYTPWIDLMYDCDYAKPETIKYMGVKYTIDNPINPMSYPDARPMIFSESEMFDYGLKESDLTEVERKILKCNKNIEKSMYELLNYYNFSDVTLNTSAAILAAFEFNREFSETGIARINNINLYPKSFEISGFSFDAYLRLILANSTQSEILDKDGFYEKLIQKTSSCTGFMFIIADFISMYIIPILRVIFVISIFLCTILAIVLFAFKIDESGKNTKRILNGTVVPMAWLFFSNVLFAWGLSLMMGRGNTDVTKSHINGISPKDPVQTTGLVILMELAYLVMLFFVVAREFKEIAGNAKMSASFLGGAIGGTFANIAKVPSNLASKVSSSGSTGGSSDKAQEGTGRQSARAARRANSKPIKDDMEEKKVRDQRNTARAKRDNADNTSSESINRTIERGKQKIENGGDGRESGARFEEGEFHSIKEFVDRSKENKAKSPDE